MPILQFILILVEVVTCLLLITIILLQRSKSEGIGLAFGAGMGETLFGSRAGNVLTRMTIILAIVFMANTVLLGLTYSGSRGQSLMGRMLGTSGRPAAAPARPGQTRPAAPAGAPSAPASGAPTLPGAQFGDEAPAAPAPAEQPAE